MKTINLFKNILFLLKFYLSITILNLKIKKKLNILGVKYLFINI